MTQFVIDASVAVKWVIAEPGTADALALRRAPLAAPDLLVAECANILWKKVRRGELTGQGAQTAAGLLALAGIELVPMRALLPEATRWAVMLAHPAYDCMYLALAAERGVPFVTADDALIRKLGVFGRSAGIPSVVALVAAAGLAGP